MIVYDTSYPIPEDRKIYGLRIRKVSGDIIKFTRFSITYTLVVWEYRKIYGLRIRKVSGDIIKFTGFAIYVYVSSLGVSQDIRVTYTQGFRGYRQLWWIYFLTHANCLQYVSNQEYTTIILSVLSKQVRAQLEFVFLTSPEKS